ncbi:MAG: type II toxin-antitoxin system VapC family toxin [Terriglobales bacterium]
MRAIDTNVLVRLITSDDSHQAGLAEQFAAPGAWVPILAIVEAVWVLASAYGRSRQELAQYIEGLLNHVTLIVQDAEHVAAALDLFRQHPRVSFSDCLLLDQARRGGHLPLGTYDRRLATLPGTALL